MHLRSVSFIRKYGFLSTQDFQCLAVRLFGLQTPNPLPKHGPTATGAWLGPIADACPGDRHAAWCFLCLVATSTVALCRLFSSFSSRQHVLVVNLPYCSGSLAPRWPQAIAEANAQLGITPDGTIAQQMDRLLQAAVACTAAQFTRVFGLQVFGAEATSSVLS